MLTSKLRVCFSFFISLLAAALPCSDSLAQVQIARPPAIENQTAAQGDWHVAGEVAPAELELTPDEKRNILVYERGNRAVVHITTRSVQVDAFYQMERPAEGSGSGSILDKSGLILTNYHVIEDARDIRVTLFNGESYTASLVGQDPVNDIAVLKIDAPAEVLFPVQYGDSSKLRVGQKVYAIGNPFGLERTMTIGIISSLNRVLPSRSGRTMKSIIQIDAALNRGNSGGPLFDSSGRLIGMNTAIASRTGENTGVGFAIPIASVKRIVPQLVENGRVIRPDIGITRVYQTDTGLMVATVAQGGPSDQAGIRGFRLVREQIHRGPYVFEQTRIDRSEADTIIGIDGQRVQTADDLLSVVENKQPGEQVVLTVVRDGETISLPVRLGEGD